MEGPQPTFSLFEIGPPENKGQNRTKQNKQETDLNTINRSKWSWSTTTNIITVQRQVSTRLKVRKPYLAFQPHQVPCRVYFINPNILNRSLLPTHATRHLFAFKYLFRQPCNAKKIKNQSYVSTVKPKLRKNMSEQSFHPTFFLQKRRTNDFLIQKLNNKL